MTSCVFHRQTRGRAARPVVDRDPPAGTGPPREEETEHGLSAAQQERVAAALRSESTAETGTAIGLGDATAPSSQGPGGVPKAALIGGGSLVAFALVGAGAWVAMRDSSEDSATQPDETNETSETVDEDAATSVVASGDDSEITSDDDRTDGESGSDAPASPGGESDNPDPADPTDNASEQPDNADPSDPDPATGAATNPGDSSAETDGGNGELANAGELLVTNEALYRGGKLYLSGPIQSQERIDYIVDLATPLLGEENVVNNYYVDPTQTTQPNGAVRIDEPLLFTTNSTELNPELQGILDLGVTAMVLFPQVTMQVIGHTDDVGPDDGNQALSEARAQAVVDYMVSKGIAPDRFDAFGLGETQPIADNSTPEGRAQNRRIDIALLDLLADAPTN